MARSESGTVSAVNVRDVRFEAIFFSGACAFGIVGDLDGTFDDATQLFTPTESGIEIGHGTSGPLCNLLGFAPGEGTSIGGSSWTNVGTPISITNL
ncbi:hypothetical protein [uncultured Aeromicrobium sp.]|uniref:hypothetical protein n=1 Tax=uncultured Aeromicrobium sp. TaxID=337820 RepID=UPI0025F60799|nr:hypothetical protein [uncultured Aeromicrobium sp.]